MPLPPVGGDGGEAGGVIVGQYWGDEGAEDNIKLPVGGRQQGDPKASGLRPRGAIGFYYFEAEAQPRVLSIFWKISAYLSYYPVSCYK